MGTEVQVGIRVHSSANTAATVIANKLTAKFGCGGHIDNVGA